MSTAAENVQVRIMQRTFNVLCAADERAQVLAAAEFLEQQMRAVSKGAQVLSMDRCAIMAGLKISHELLELRKNASQNAQVDARLQNLHQQVDEAVNGMRGEEQENSPATVAR